MAYNHLQPTRSPDFHFTIENKSDPEFIALKAQVKDYNRNRPVGANRIRTKVQGRGYYEYNRGWFGTTPYSPHDKATHFDVYVYECYDTQR